MLMKTHHHWQPNCLTSILSWESALSYWFPPHVPPKSIAKVDIRTFPGIQLFHDEVHRCGSLSIFIIVKVPSFLALFEPREGRQSRVLIWLLWPTWHWSIHSSSPSWMLPPNCISKFHFCHQESLGLIPIGLHSNFKPGLVSTATGSVKRISGR